MEKSKELSLKESQGRIDKWLSGVGVDAKKTSEKRIDDRNNLVAYILIDCSTSMNEIVKDIDAKVVGFARDEYGRSVKLVDSDKTKLTFAKHGAVNFASDAIRKGYTIGIIKFGDGASVECKPVKDIENIKRSLNRLVADGCTEMSRGIETAIAENPSIIVIVTDGQPYGKYDVGSDAEKQKTIASAKRAASAGIDIITIGTGDADLDFLRKIATKSELASYVKAEKLESAISSAVKFLPGPQR